jgi:hypothetical protein
VQKQSRYAIGGSDLFDVQRVDIIQRKVLGAVGPNLWIQIFHDRSV